MPVRRIDTGAIQQALIRCQRKAAELFQQKFLIVDDEHYGVVDLPRSMNLFRGRVLLFPGYGQVQIVSVNADTLWCSRSIDAGLVAATQHLPRAVEVQPLRKAGSEFTVDTKTPYPTEFM